MYLEIKKNYEQLKTFIGKKYNELNENINDLTVIGQCVLAEYEQIMKEIKKIERENKRNGI